MTQYTLEEFAHRVVIPVVSLEHSYEIQSWCEDQMGLGDDGAWALGYDGDPDWQSWYFAEGKNALMFKLRWG